MENFFDTLGLKLAVFVDSDILETNYLKAQEMFHPDKHGSNQAMRLAAEKMSSKVNEAYKVLKSDSLRLRHLLELLNLDTQSPEPEILMEVMEVREQVAEVITNGTDATALKTELQSNIAIALNSAAQAYEAIAAQGGEQATAQPSENTSAKKEFSILQSQYHRVNYYAKALVDLEQGSFNDIM